MHGQPIIKIPEDVQRYSCLATDKKTVLHLASEKVKQNKLEQNNAQQRNRNRNKNDLPIAIFQTIMPISGKPGSVLYTFYSR